MRFQRFAILFITLTLCTLASLAQTVRLQAPSQAVEGRNFQVSIVLTNVEGNAPAPPRIDNCTLRFGPSTSTMTSMEFVNGKSKSTVTRTYTYTYSADKASTVNIPSLTVNGSDGKQYTTSAAKLTILPPEKDAPADNRRTQPSADPFSGFSADDMFVRVNLSKSSVYEQEPVIATVKVYTRYDISQFRVISQPTFEGFLSEELNVPNKVEMEAVNGKNYYTMELKRCILYPREAGKLSIKSGKYEVTLQGYITVSQGFFPVTQRVEKKMNTETNTATLTVKALPEPRPAAFDGAVGRFQVSTDLSPLELRTNESATYTLSVTGSGNIKYLKTPQLQLPAGIEQFTPQTDIDASFTGANITGSYKVEYTLVPQEPGDFTIPGWTFCYFDPQDGTYHSTEIPAYNIKVAKGLAAPATEQKQIASGMTDILHIKQSTTPLVKDPQFVFHSAFYWILFALCTLALLTAVFVYRHVLRSRADVDGRRRARASKAAAKRLRRARAAMSAATADRFYAELSKAMFGYLGDKFNIPASQLIRDKIASELSARDIDEATAAEIIGILDECEMARFTPAHSDSEMSDLYKKALTAIKKIDNSKRK